MRTGQTYSFQELIKNMIPVEITAGFTRGSTTSPMIFRCPVPSSRATSISERGMVRMDCLIRKMPVASLSWGRMTPMMLLANPSLDTVR